MNAIRRFLRTHKNDIYTLSLCVIAMSPFAIVAVALVWTLFFENPGPKTETPAMTQARQHQELLKALEQVRGSCCCSCDVTCRELKAGEMP